MDTLTPGGAIGLMLVLGFAIWFVRARTADPDAAQPVSEGSGLHRLFRWALAAWAIAFPVISCSPLFVTGTDSAGAVGVGGLTSLVLGATLFGPWIVGLLVLGVLVWVSK